MRTLTGAAASCTGRAVLVALALLATDACAPRQVSRSGEANVAAATPGPVKDTVVPTLPDAPAPGPAAAVCGHMTDSILDLNVHGRESPVAAARATYAFPAGARVVVDGVTIHVFEREKEVLTFVTQHANDGSWLVHALTVYGPCST